MKSVTENPIQLFTISASLEIRFTHKYYKKAPNRRMRHMIHQPVNFTGRRLHLHFPLCEYAS
jgi:hypothetical protein